jgi:putative ABC transport system ATP-binding protein
MVSNDQLIEVKGLKKTYTLGKTFIEVLKGVDLSVDKGEFVMIMGPSGSGKSTLLHIVAGLDRPTEGDVKVLGENLKKLSDRQLSRLRNLKVGFVFQFYYLFPELTAYENVYLPGILFKGVKNEQARAALVQRVDEMFEIIGLNHRKLHRPQELSGGEQQRLAIARALINEPEILLADEPTGNLDSASGEIILEFFERFQKAKKLSILMVTHNPEFLKRAQRVLFLKDGKIVDTK